MRFWFAVGLLAAACDSGSGDHFLPPGDFTGFEPPPGLELATYDFSGSDLSMPDQGATDLAAGDLAGADLATGDLAVADAGANHDFSLLRGNKAVFVTSRAYSANLGGVTGADGICQGLANAAGLPGTYKAWLSVGAMSPANRMTQAAVPYLLVDGTIVAANWVSLTNFSLQHAINLTETGGAPPASNFLGTMCTGARSLVWTGTDETGNSVFQSESCAGWTDPISTAGAVFGNYLPVNGWSFQCHGGMAAACGSVAPLYCFQQ